MSHFARSVMVALAAAFAGLACTPVTIAAEDAAAIIYRAFEAGEANSDLAELYVFRHRVEMRLLDKQGGLKKQETKTWDVTLLDGSVYERLIALDDEPLSEKREAKEQRKLERQVDKLRNESPAKREKRLAKVEEGRQEDLRFREEITRAFDFRLTGEERVAGADAWVISAEPRPDYEPSFRKARVLGKLRATLWISKNDYAWVKADIDTFEPFSWSVVKIKPGTRIRFSQQHVNGEVWLMDTWEVEARGRVLLVKGFNVDVSGSYSDFRKFTTSTDVVDPQLQPGAR